MRYRALGLGTLGMLGFLGLWQWLANGPMGDTALPTATETLRTLVDQAQTGHFWSQVWATLFVAMQGLVIATVIAIPLGLVIGTNRYVAAVFHIPLEIARPIPPIVILPLALAEFGSTPALARFLTVVGILPSLVLATAGGVSELDPVREDTGRSFRLSPVQRARRIVLPSAMPSIITGIRISAFASILTVVMSQIVGGAPGLGNDIRTDSSAGLNASAYAIVIAVALLGFVVDTLVTMMQRQVLRWHDSVRGTRQVYPRQPRFRSITEPCADFVAKVAAPFGNLLSALVPDRRRRAPSRTVLAVLTWGTPAALLVAWWFGSANSTNPLFLPLKKILETFRREWLFAGFKPHVVPSLENLLFGFLIAAVVGILIGGAIGIFAPFRELVEPLLALFRSLPGVAFIPILVTLMGFGDSMRITTIAFASSFPIMISAADGVRAMDPMMKEVASAYRLSRGKQIWSMYLPAAMPRVMTGLKIGLSTSLVVMVASELLGVNVGIGAQVNEGQQSFDNAKVWAGVILLAIIGLVTNYLLALISQRVLRWHDGQRAAARAN